MDIMISDLFKIYKNMCKNKDVFYEYFYDRHDIYASVTMNNEDYDDKKILKYGMK